jgi:hypothetical protein
MKRLRKRIALILAFLLILFLALGPLWPLTSALSERVWWIILVLVGLALAWPRGVFGESPAPQVNPPKNLAKKERILAYLRAAKNSQFAQEDLSDMLSEMAVGILAFKRGGGKRKPGGKSAVENGQMTKTFGMFFALTSKGKISLGYSPQLWRPWKGSLDDHKGSAKLGRSGSRGGRKGGSGKA